MTKDHDRICLITKADDLGSSESANRAFYDCYRQGILRNGVIMTACAQAEQAAKLFRDEKGFCMGLHLTLNAEWDRVKWGPVLPREKVPSLVDENGFFYPTTKRLHDNNPDRGEIFAELQAQLDAARSYGLDIKFADTHMGFSWVLDGLDGGIREWCGQNGILYLPVDFNILPETNGEGDPVENLISRLEAAEPGVYFIHMGHPAYDTEETRMLGHAGYENVAAEREWDRRKLTDRRILEYFSENGVVPITLTQAFEMAQP